jgi:hypothetical protein
MSDRFPSFPAAESDYARQLAEALASFNNNGASFLGPVPVLGDEKGTNRITIPRGNFVPEADNPISAAIAAYEHEALATGEPLSLVSGQLRERLGLDLLVPYQPQTQIPLNPGTFLHALTLHGSWERLRALISIIEKL